ncbi:7562_t:CDS:1, partial [Ambispora leptoticha]
GVDYEFEGEKYHAPDQDIKGHTIRNYKIISPQLQKVVQKYLSQQIAIFMQFDFEEQVYISERIRPDNVGQN